MAQGGMERQQQIKLLSATLTRSCLLRPRAPLMMASRMAFKNKIAAEPLFHLSAAEKSEAGRAGRAAGAKLPRTHPSVGALVWFVPTVVPSRAQVPRLCFPCLSSPSLLSSAPEQGALGPWSCTRILHPAVPGPEPAPECSVQTKLIHLSVPVKVTPLKSHIFAFPKSTEVMEPLKMSAGHR